MSATSEHRPSWKDLLDQHQHTQGRIGGLDHYESIVGLPNWAEVERRFGTDDQGEAE